MCVEFLLCRAFKSNLISLFIIVSIIGWVIIGLLFMSELNNFLTVTSKEHMSVDTSLGQMLKINIDITFHALTCAEVMQSLWFVSIFHKVLILGSFGCNGCRW